MTKIVQYLLVVVFIQWIGLNKAIAMSKFDISKDLMLELRLDGTNLQLDHFNIPLTLTLRNKTNRTLKYIVSTTPHPVSVDLWNLKGFNLTLQHLPPAVKDDSNPGREMTKKPNEVIVFSKKVDLSIYKNETKAGEDIVLKASFVAFIFTKETVHYGYLKSNELAYKLPAIQQQ